jgi:hypothetical protein
MNIQPGCKVFFEPNKDCEPVLRKCGPEEERKPDRFDKVLGAADIKCARTNWWSSLNFIRLPSAKVKVSPSLESR